MTEFPIRFNLKDKRNSYYTIIILFGILYIKKNYGASVKWHRVFIRQNHLYIFINNKIVILKITIIG